MKTAPAWYSKGAGVNTASPISSTKDGHNSTNRSSSDISQPVVKQYSSQIHSRKNAGQMLPLDGKNASSLTSESATHAYSLPLNGLLSVVEWPSFPCAHHEDMKAGIAEIWRDLTTSLARVNTLMKISWPWASYSQFSDLVKLQIKLLRFQYSKCYLNTLKEHSPERKHQVHPRWLILVNSALVRPRLAVLCLVSGLPSTRQTLTYWSKLSRRASAWSKGWCTQCTRKGWGTGLTGRRLDWRCECVQEIYYSLQLCNRKISRW